MEYNDGKIKFRFKTGLKWKFMVRLTFTCSDGHGAGGIRKESINNDHGLGARAEVRGLEGVSVVV